MPIAYKGVKSKMPSGWKDDNLLWKTRGLILHGYKKLTLQTLADLYPFALAEGQALSL